MPVVSCHARTLDGYHASLMQVATPDRHLRQPTYLLPLKLSITGCFSSLADFSALRSVQDAWAV